MLYNLLVGLIVYAGAVTLLPAVAQQGRRPQRPSPVSWRSTVCSTIAKAPDHIPYHKAVSFVAPNGDKVSLNAHVIFRRSPEDEVSITSRLWLKTFIHKP